MSPQTSTQLLTALERSGPRPALAWYGEAARIELSGHVLANWVIKSIGHLHDDLALEPEETVVLDLPVHWKRLALALAAWSLGADVTILDRDRDGKQDPEHADAVPAPRVVATDRPDSPLAADADEVLALEAVSLAPRFDGTLPALAHDWVAEVRASPDQLGVDLPAWSGPSPAVAAPLGGGAVPRLLVAGDGLTAAPEMLGALLAGGGIVGPRAAVGEDRAREEAVTGHASGA